MITRIGGRAVQFLTVCRDDLKSLVEEGMKLFEIEAPVKEPDGDLIAQLETRDITIEQLHQNVAELNSKITELERKLNETNSKPLSSAAPKARSPQSTKGKGKKK